MLSALESTPPFDLDGQYCPRVNRNEMDFALLRASLRLTYLEQSTDSEFWKQLCPLWRRQPPAQPEHFALPCSQDAAHSGAF